MEAYRGLIAAGFQPDRTVEFHWYSAEVCFTYLRLRSVCKINVFELDQEGGLLGSQAVAKSYESRNVNVVAMSQVRVYRFKTQFIAI